MGSEHIASEDSIMSCGHCWVSRKATLRRQRSRRGAFGEKRLPAGERQGCISKGRQEHGGWGRRVRGGPRGQGARSEGREPGLEKLPGARSVDVLLAAVDGCSWLLIRGATQCSDHVEHVLCLLLGEWAGGGRTRSQGPVGRICRTLVRGHALGETQETRPDRLEVPART